MRGPALPIDKLAGKIASVATGASPVRAVVQAPTGSGKSTRLPQILIDGGGVEGEVVVLQPRRVAARMLARRVAWERGCRVGEEVGYQVRFERVVSKNTRIRYVTEGVLLRQLQRDPNLQGVAAVVFDEFHERHIDGDVGLAFLRQMQETRRPDLQLYMVSATLDGMDWKHWLPGAQTIFSEGRSFPVEIRHLARDPGPREEIWEVAVRELVRCVAAGDPGDVLIFMPGVFEIRRTLEHLSRQSWAKGWELLPLYGDLPPEKQDRALSPTDARKIVVATNVAETSVTIDGVRLVIDSGLARMADYDAARGIDTLTIQSISQASAKQRAGRAGRTAPGQCLRLWSARVDARRPPHTAPEIHRLDPSGVMLDLLALGIGELDAFPWVEAPHPEAMERAWKLLASLGAVDDERLLTPIGSAMAKLPLHPRMSRFLVEARARGCVPLAARVAALTEGRGIFAGASRKARAAAAEQYWQRGDFSDFQQSVRAMQAADAEGIDRASLERLGLARRPLVEAFRLSQQLAGLAGGGETRGHEGEDAWGGVVACLLAAFSDHVAVQISEGTRTCDVAGGRRGKISPDCRVAPKARLLIATEIAEVEGRKLEVLLRQVTQVHEDLLNEIHSGDFHDRDEVLYDTTSKRVVTRRERCWRDLVLASKTVQDAPGDRAAELMAEEVMAGRLVLPGWDGGVERWVARLNGLASWMPELELPVFGEEDKALIVHQVCEGAMGAKDLKNRKVAPVLKQWLSKTQRAALDAYAPDQVVLENGRKARIQYVPGQEPEIRLLIQQVYDVRRHPCIADGRVPVVVVLLAPNQRPAQKTSDLPGFWKTGYPEIKKQLKGRYPKHEWR